MRHAQKSISKKGESSWGEVADWYDTMLEEKQDTYQSRVILPNLLRMLALKRGERVIDIACGQGFFTRALQGAGASVTGTDISKELIALAHEKSPDIPFVVAPSDALTFAHDASFDTALMVLALQNIEHLDATVSEVRRVLVPHGRFVLVLNHPTFRVLKHSSWGFDEREGVQYRRVDRYLSAQKVSIDMHPGSEGGPRTLSYNRSLQDIVKSLCKNGFAITRLEEWISHRTSGKGPRQKAEDTARKEIPLFMALELRLLQ